MTMNDKIKKLEEQAAAAKKKWADLEAQKKALAAKNDALAKERERKNDTRRKIILGGYMFSKMQGAPEFSAQVIKGLDAVLKKPNDRELFGLPALAQETGQNAPPAAQPAKPTHIPAELPKTAPAASSVAANIAQVATPLPKADYYAKDKVKALGATFVVESKTWFVPAGADLTPFENWL